jgi:hypothetical protein
MTRTAPLSVLLGDDSEALDILIEMHTPALPPWILDVTYNTGKMWQHCRFAEYVWRADIARYDTHVRAAFEALPFGAATFDAVVFDPPHLPTHAASVYSSGIWREHYGITATGQGREGDNVTGMFVPFLVEARRVLVPEGIVLAKIADIVHNHRYQWQQVAFVTAAWATGMTPCDCLVKRDPRGGNLQSGRWQSVKHLKRCHSYWIVVRNSTRCEVRR